MIPLDKQGGVMACTKQISLVVFVALFAVSGQAIGADASVIQSLSDEFRNQTGSWFGPLQNIATWLLLSLATISWVWTAGQMVLKNSDIQEILVELVRMILYVGFFLALIINAAAWSEALIRGFMYAGGQAAGGAANELNPAAILERGFILGSSIIESSGRLTFIAFAIIALVATILYAAIAAYALLVMAEMYIVTAAGVLLLGFGGSQWTSDYAKRYISYCISVGAKLYVMFLIVGLGEQFIFNWAMGEDKSQYSVVMSIVAVLVMLVLLVKMLPDLIQGIINGSSLGGSMPSITGMAGAAAGAALGAGVGAVGGAMAVREASKLASEQLGGAASSALSSAASSGAGQLNAAAPGGAAPGGNSPLPMPSSSTGASTPGASSSESGSPKSPGRLAHAAQTVKNLGGAAKQNAAGRLMGDYNASHGTVGANMAQTMRAERMGMTPSESPHTGGPASSPMSGSIGPGEGGPNAPAPWFAQTGGFESLSLNDQGRAAEAHAEWQDADPDRNTFGVEDYVSYTQGKHQERQAAEEEPGRPYYSPANSR